MLKRSLVLVLMVIYASAFLIFSNHEQCASQGITQDEAYYNEIGLSHFNKGFYKLMPKGKEDEASQLFEQAITAFKDAIAINETYVKAHRNLARVYYVQERFSEAAEAYKKVIELIPHDIDVYLKIASAYAKLQKYSEAIEQLEKAKTISSEETIINRLNDFIKRLEQKE